VTALGAQRVPGLTVGERGDRIVSRGLVAVALGAIGQLSSLGLLATSAWLITTSSLRPPILTLTVAIAAVRAFALVRGLGRYGERLFSHDLALRLLARVRVSSYRHLERLVPGGLGEIERGDVISRIVADVDATQDLVVRVALPVVVGLATSAAAVAIDAYLLPSAGLVLAAGLLCAGALVPGLGHRLGQRASTALATERGRVAAVVVETLEGANDLVAFGATEAALGGLARAEAALARLLVRTARAGGTSNAIGALVGGATTLGVVALGAANLTGAPQARLGSPIALAVAAFVALAAFDAVATLPDAFSRLGQALGAARRVRALASMPSPVREPSRPLSPPSDPTILLEDVSVAYVPGGRPVLEHIDLFLPRGRRLAVVGESGAGKTTLALTLLRFLEPCKGVMSLGGEDVANLAPDEVRAQIAWAPQDPALFATTLSANLRLACPDADDGELVEVLASVGLAPWLASLPDGLSSRLGERGERVSGGERQRIGLARALLAGRPILLCDEPSAHLDKASEGTVREAVLRASAGRTLIWITHRLVGLEAFDEVVVLSRGRIVERGHAGQLAHAKGPYAALLAAADEREVC
jgi:ATP-binding cassette subfamily C protein CydCD